MITSGSLRRMCNNVPSVLHFFLNSTVSVMMLPRSRLECVGQMLRENAFT